MKPKQNLISAAIILLALLGGGIYYWWWTGTPEYALAQLRKAVETHDVELGMKYIDVDSIFDDFWRKQQAQALKELTSKSSAEAFGTALGMQFVESIKPSMKEGIRQLWIDAFSTTTARTAEDNVDTIFQEGLTVVRQGSAAHIFFSNGVKVMLKRKAGERYWVISAIDNPSNEQSKISTQQSVSQVSAPQAKTSNQPTAPTPPNATIPTRFEGIASIYITGGVWDNWDADVEKDGPVIAIVYRDRDDEWILDDAAYKVPISADVKVYAGESAGSAKTKLVFSGKFTDKQMVRCAFSNKCIRIPREEINVNTATDSEYGAVEVTVHTPKQGDFSTRGDLIVLYLKK